MMATPLEEIREFTDPPADEIFYLRILLGPYERVLAEFVETTQERIDMIRAIQSHEVPYIDAICRLFSQAAQEKHEEWVTRREDEASLANYRAFPEEKQGRCHLTLMPQAVAISRTMAFYDAVAKMTHELSVSIDRATGEAGVTTRSFSDKDRYCLPHGERCVASVSSTAEFKAAVDEWFYDIGGVYAPIVKLSSFIKTDMKAIEREKIMPDTPYVTHEDFKPYDDAAAAFINLIRKRISVVSTVSGGGLQGTFSGPAEGQTLASIDHIHSPGRPLHSEIIFNPARDNRAFNRPAPVTYAVTLDMDVIDDRISLTFDTYRHGQLDASARAQDHVLSPTCLNRVLHEWFEGVGGPYAQMPQISGLEKLVRYEAV